MRGASAGSGHDPDVEERRSQSNYQAIVGDVTGSIQGDALRVMLTRKLAIRILLTPQKLGGHGLITPKTE